MDPLERLELEEIVRYLSSLGLRVLSVDPATGVVTVQLPSTRSVSRAEPR